MITRRGSDTWRRIKFVNGSGEGPDRGHARQQPGGGWVYQAPGQGNNPAPRARTTTTGARPQQGSHKTAPTAGRFSFEINVEEAGTVRILLRASPRHQQPRRRPQRHLDQGRRRHPERDAERHAEAHLGRRRLRQVQERAQPTSGSTPRCSRPRQHGDKNPASDVVFDKGMHTITFAPRSTGFHIDSVQMIKKGRLEPSADRARPHPGRPSRAEPEDRTGVGATGVETRERSASPPGTTTSSRTRPAPAATSSSAATATARSRSACASRPSTIDKDAEIKSAYFVFEAAETSKGAAHFEIEIEDTTERQDLLKADAPDDRGYLDDGRRLERRAPGRRARPTSRPTSPT